jgi:hypothetical protein
MNKIINTAFLICCLSFTAQAQTSDMVIGTAKQQPVYNEYLTIDESDSVSRNRPAPTTTFSAIPEEFSSERLILAAKKVINLLSWILHEEPRPMPSEAYMRKEHFGRWINDPTDESCMNTRAKVLVRESEEEVTFRNEKQCVVASGKWLDRYSNTEFTSSREIQIDHMVPLKHAYMSGAWAWDYKTRCLFANYLGYNNHLVPASVRENTSKGDRAPDKYLPSELSYRCQYIKDWLAIKLIWKLNLTADEAQAIHEVIENYHCRPSDFQVNPQELKSQRQQIIDNIEYCTVNRR